MTTGSDQATVVAGIDGSESALGGARWAAEFAAGRQLPLTLLHVIPRLDWHRAGADLTPGSDGVLAAAADVARTAHPDLEIHLEAVKGTVAAALTDASRTVRLLVIGAGAADHRALGGHAVRVVHRAMCPVLVWRSSAAKRTGKPLPIVVGVDESDASARALAEAFDIAAMSHAPLSVAHMWDLGAAVGMGDLGGQGMMDWQLLDVLESRQRRRVDELTDPLSRRYRNVRVSKVFQDISPAKGLIELSREAQLVVVGSHGSGGLGDMLLGSVSQNVVHHAECRVLVVR